MVNYREILRLHSLGQSQRTIRSSAHCSDNTVRTVLEVASQKGIQWPLDDDITNADLERMLFPDKYKSACLYIEPDYPYIRNRQISRRIKKHLWLSNRSWARDVHSFGILHSWGALAGKSCSAQASSIWLIAGAFRRTQSK